MNQPVKPLPRDPEKLQEMVVQLQGNIFELQAKLDTQEEKIAHQSDYINQLIEAIRLARHRAFGSKSERHDSGPQQLSLLFNEAETLQDHESEQDASPDVQPTQVAGYRRRKRTGGRRKLPAHFPRVEVVHELPESDCQCDHCAGTLKVIGEKVSEQIELVPMTVKVIKHIRKTYVCTQCKQGIKAARLPAQPIPGSIASAGTLAHVAINKYVNGMPLYRQEQAFKRLEIPLLRSTLAHWMVKSGQLTQPLINLMRELMLQYDTLQMDETRCQVLKEAGKTPQSQSYMWVQRGGPPDRTVIVYNYSPSRNEDVPIALLDDYAGFLQTDGYPGYQKVCTDNGIIHLGCWAHARRKFDSALKAQGKIGQNKPSLAKQAMLRIQNLYRIERQAKKMTPDERLKLRQSRSVPALEDLRKWLDRHLLVVVKQSELGKAMHYLDNQWEKLMVYTTDGRLHIDNNLCENAIRPFVIGRKNHLFSDTVSGAKASANLYSLIETAKANGLEPYQYLKRVFSELPKATTVEEIENLMPFKPIGKKE